MKIAFFGTSDFAVPSLKKLAQSKHKICLVVTQPDRKKGRHLKLKPSPVKVEAEKLKIPVHQPGKLSNTDSINLLKKIKADLFVVVAFGQILKSQVLQLPKFYCMNLHGSLLPKFRGAAPINWAVIKGEKTSGVTIIKMNEKMDAGDIILSEKNTISDKDTSLSLSGVLSERGADLLLKAVKLLEKDNVKLKRQDESKVSYAPKLEKENGHIDWKKPAIELHNLARGLMPWPTAFTFWNKKLLKILRTEIDDRDFKLAPGVIAECSDKGIVVKTVQKNLVIKELQLEGAKKMEVSSFLRGHKLKAGDVLK